MDERAAEVARDTLDELSQLAKDYEKEAEQYERMAAERREAKEGLLKRIRVLALALGMVAPLTQQPTPPTEEEVVDPDASYLMFLYEKFKSEHHKAPAAEAARYYFNVTLSDRGRLRLMKELGTEDESELLEKLAKREIHNRLRRRKKS